MRVCLIGGCEMKWYCKDWCKRHYERWRIHGDPLEVRQGGESNYNWRPHARYHAMHKRVRTQRGPAADHTCTCGVTAEEWSYDHADPDEVSDMDKGHSLPYSLDVNHYDPRCVPCHRRFDLEVPALSG